MPRPKPLAELAQAHVDGAEAAEMHGDAAAQREEQRRAYLQRTVARAMLQTAAEALDVMRDEGIEPDVARPESADETLPEVAWALTAEKRTVIRAKTARKPGEQFVEYKGYAIADDGRLVRYRKTAPIQSHRMFKHGAPKVSTYFEPCELPTDATTTVVDYVNPDGFLPPESLDPLQTDPYEQEAFQDWHSKVLGSVVARRLME